MYHHSPNNTNDSIDERFDVFYNEKSNTQLDCLFNNLTVSPPLSSNEKEQDNDRNDSVWFKESIDDDDEEEDEGIDETLDSHYLNIDLLTPATSPLSEVIEYEDDNDSINESLVEETPVEAATQIIESVEEDERKAPTSMYDYHMDFVNLYKDAILRQTDPHTIPHNVIDTIESTLPDFYKNYVDCVKKSFSVPSICL